MSDTDTTIIYADRESLAGTKTVLLSDNSIVWTAKDKISLFINSGEKGGYKFISTNSEDEASVTFTGSESITPGAATYWAVYPYNASASCNGEFITTVLPSEQTGKAGSFDNDLFISIAKSSSNKMYFYNVCGGIKFTVVKNGIKKVVFTNIDGSSIAGTLKVGFNSNGLPTVQSITNGTNSVTVSAPDNGTFATGTAYYAVIPPTIFSAGVEIKYIKENDEIGSVEISKPSKVERGIVSRLLDKDSDLNFSKAYLTFSSEGTSTLALRCNSLRPKLEYSYDGKIWTGWTDSDNDGSYDEINITSDSPLLLRGTNPSGLSLTSDRYCQFIIKGDKVSCKGDIMKLLNHSGNNLTAIPRDYCFRSLFKDCTPLISGPDLTATNLAGCCYQDMFRGCSSLQKAPELPATTLAAACYQGMFSGCTCLTAAPMLPATWLTDNCYCEMFFNCSGLNYIKALFTTTPSDSYTKNWVDGVASSGVFIKNGDAKWNLTGVNGVPENWATVNLEESQGNYLMFTSDGTSTLRLSLNGDCCPYLEYSYDGIVWTKWEFDKSTFNPKDELTFTSSNPLCIRGINPDGLSTSTNNYCTFKMSGDKVYCHGNVMWLIDYTDNLYSIPYSYFFYRLFDGCDKLITAPVLPATSLSSYCYRYMFSGCKGLLSAPELPATTLADECYGGMFEGCTGLTSAPELPATVLADGCYTGMFSGCSGLVAAPKLPATNLAKSCYWGMFAYCTRLTTAPMLPATTLAESCYGAMFADCTSLVDAPELPAMTLAEWCYYAMFSGCTSLVDAPELPAMTLAKWCYYTMFHKCSGLKNAPSIAATTLATRCCMGMFEDCTSLIYAPELPATNLAGSCYQEMFKNCTGLKYAPTILPATGVNAYGYQSMFEGCTNLIQAPEISAMSCGYRSCTYMFSGCTRLTVAPELPATELGYQCYMDMFSGCTGLTTAPKELPATQLGEICYSNMFRGCTSLTTAPDIAATRLANGCCDAMFQDCTSLTSAPELRATALKDHSYANMFMGCRKLDYIKAMFTTYTSSSLANWVSGVASNGTFIKNSKATWDVTGINGIPTGWTVKTASE